MRPGRTARKIQAVTLEAEHVRLRMKPGDRSPALIDDHLHTGMRRQSVMDGRERDAIRHTIRRGKQRFILRQLLPIATMNKNQQRGVARSSWKIIQGFFRLVAPLQILLANERFLGLPASNRVLRQKRLYGGHTTAWRIFLLDPHERPIAPGLVLWTHTRVTMVALILHSLRFRNRQKNLAPNCRWTFAALQIECAF